MEAVPQIHILICLFVSNDSDVLSGPVPFTFATSVFSGGFGIAKFLKTGPCKSVPGSSGFLDGFVSIGFPAVFLSVIATFVGKGFMLPVVAKSWGNGPGALVFYRVVIWVGLNLVPQFIYVSMKHLKL